MFACKFVLSSFILLVCGTSGANAQSECDKLNLIIRLGHETLIQQERVDTQAWDEMLATINSVENNQLLLTLQQTGQAGSFGNLRNFLTQLNVMARFSSSDEIIVTPEIRQFLHEATTIVDTTCTRYDDLVASAASRDPAQGDRYVGNAQNSSVSSVALSPEQKALLSRKSDLKRLGMFAVGIALAIGLIYLMYTGLILLRVVKRGRRICEIPAQLSCSLTQIDGMITIIGKKGCRFIPNVPLGSDAQATMTSGTYCTLTANGQEFGAKLFQDSEDDCRMLFGTALDKSALSALLQSSLSRHQYDFSIVAEQGSSKQQFRKLR